MAMLPTLSCVKNEASICRSIQSRSWPSLLRRISAPWRLAHPPAVMACFTEAVSNWTVIQFSN